MTYTRTPKPATSTPLLEKRLGVIRRLLRDILLALASWIQGHPVWPSPLAHFYALEDRPGRIYVWTLNPSCTDDEAQDMAAAFLEAHVKRFNREPRALHIITPDVDQIRHLTREEAEQVLVPWLKEE